MGGYLSSGHFDLHAAVQGQFHRRASRIWWPPAQPLHPQTAKQTTLLKACEQHWQVVRPFLVPARNTSFLHSGPTGLKTFNNFQQVLSFAV